jgi:hypothetical protein
MLGFILACFSRLRLKKSGTTRDLPHGATASFTRALRVYSFRKYFVDPIDHLDL